MCLSPPTDAPSTRNSHPSGGAGGRGGSWEAPRVLVGAPRFGPASTPSGDGGEGGRGGATP